MGPPSPKFRAIPKPETMASPGTPAFTLSLPEWVRLLQYVHAKLDEDMKRDTDKAELNKVQAIVQKLDQQALPQIRGSLGFTEVPEHLRGVSLDRVWIEAVIESTYAELSRKSLEEWSPPAELGAN